MTLTKTELAAALVGQVGLNKRETKSMTDICIAEAASKCATLGVLRSSIGNPALDAIPGPASLYRCRENMYRISRPARNCARGPTKEPDLCQ